CGGTLAMMDAGVPIKAPVAGIAMGLIKTGENYSVLTDIQGLEDALGDMDFKVAGTAKGITALQMDIKIDGLNRNILKESLEQAKKGRLAILESMTEVIDEPNEEESKHAPKIIKIKIDTDKISTIIDPSSKQINIKINELNRNILKESLEQAKKGRLAILESMTEVIDEPNEEVSKHAPKIIKMQIDPDKIRTVIGPSGKQINKIIEETDVKID